MKELEKRIKINDNRVLLYLISPGFAKRTFTITEGFILNGEILKTYSLSQWDDYGLSGFINNKDENKISFEFPRNHPLYLPLFHLLNYEKKLIIDSDDTSEDNIKYLSIYLKNGAIFMDFIDNSDYSNVTNYPEKFYVFIKNICQDGRSKIDQLQKDTKKRLFVFFNEVHEILTNDNYQISMEEYLLDKFINDESYEVTKVFKRNYRKY